ncbi:PREDICTED: MAX gene-associated protein isoform X6 [Ceratotherium simum simum]|uniref:MAX gene-associated protein isoform X6 n=1 Tax=Ceratotherium simum simum TaxID=73337 RepID=A0ABM1C947_CERSS|nr:PREDICTED: MAX gene-associated protein isoform X6 [Ceratotherium simum simum]
MEEKQQIILANQDGGTVAGTAPTFFVILKQPGNGKTDQGILVTNRDACALASSVSSPGKAKGKICLPADCTVGGITVTLDNNSMWNEFYHRSTEMILTKQGRRMFPYCRYWITGLDSNMKYILVMDISPVDNHRYKWNGRWWEPSGKAEPHVLGRVFIHPESPSTGHYWMHQPVSFYKLKLTNNTLDQEGHIILHSMHRYLPRLHLVPAEKATEVIQLNGPGVHTFTFPQTEFFAVTAYQNIQITQLKIDYNPFAKGFRDDGLNSKPQRDGKQKNSSDQEGNSVPSSPGQRVRLTEGEGSEIQLPDSDSLSRVHETSGKGLEKTSLNIKRDLLGFVDIDSLDEVPQLKQEVSESLVASNFEDGSHAASPLDPNGNFNVVIKEEPLDDYEYGLGECPEGVTVKQEETDEETDVYSNSDDDPILEKQLKRHNKVDSLEADHSSSKWLPNSPSGVAKAKMFKLDAGKMPVVYLEPCAVTKSTVKISELPDNMLSTSRKDKSSVLTELDYLPMYVENSNETAFCLGKESENSLRKHSPDLRVVQKYPSLKEPQWKYPDISDSFNTERILDSSKSSAGDSFLGKEDLGRKRTTMLKISTASKAVNANQNTSSNVPGKRGRPRKLKLSKAGRPPKNIGKSLTSTKNTPMGPGSTFPDVKPDLEDVDGVLFVSFESKEALDIHAVDGTTEEPCSLQASTTNDPGCRARISQLEKELIEDLKALRHKQVIHPGLQEVGLKLNSVDPTMSIDLKYLGVQLPLAPATSFSFWNPTGTNPASPDAGFPFVSRTGKTNDFTKIKGWRGKFHSASASRNEGGNSESSLKNRSAFCSDKLDEYLENEGKLMETSMGFSSNAPASPVVYQLPTKSTSYVRTLDSVLKKQSTISPSTSYSLKPHSVPPASRKVKSQNKQATCSGRTKSSYKSILPYPVSPKQKHTHMIPGDKVTKNSSSTISENQVNNFVVPTLDENTFPKQISLRQAHQQQQQQQQGTRPPGLSKSQVKLMDLEDCALWEGKPRTYITEERADVSLTTLLTAQASLKTKPIHTIIRKRAPPCNNDFCRLGCICSSLALEKRQPAHCRRPDCMFGCTCLKRKVVLVKGGSKTKHFQRKAAHRDPVFYDPLGEEQREEEETVKEEEEQLKEKKKRKKLEYTICETEPEQPVRHYPLWVKVEGEVDPEPVYIPTPSVIEPMKPLLLPQPEVLSATVKGKLLTGIKPARAYTPKPNPVIREEDKDPIYLYFESMMTCARVRVYERKKEEQRQPSPSPSPSFQQQGSCHSSPENCSVKEPDSEQQPLKPVTCDLEDDSDKSQEKSWKSSCNEGESSSTSYVHQRSPGGPTKLIEIISDCNWEEDRSKILSILSQHINSNMPQSLKVGSFIIELASQRKSRGEKNPPVYSSRVKISMPSCQDQDDMAEKSGSETPDGPLSPGKMDDISPVQTDALDSVRERLHGGKGLPFYAGLSPAGKLVAYKRKPSSSTSGLIQVNGKSYPQAKLLLGQMGALHPANRLAAYITGRLRPSVLDLSTLSTVISKVASNAKVAASRKPRTLLPSTSNSKTASSSGTTTNRPGKHLKAFVPAKRPIENAPQIPVATPQVSPNTVKRPGPRLLLIPVQQGSPTLRPVPNTQLQGHRMVLQPVRSPSGMNLFRHPNGQIVQLLPLHQLRGSNTQPNLQPVVFRNPGSVMGIRLPTPSKPSETPPSSASSSAFSVMNPVIQAVGSSPAVNVITQAPSLLSSGPSFVSQSGTLTLRISPPEPQSFASKTGSETKITYSSGGQPVGTASLIPLQSGSFALLQLPGQKPVPSSILQHVASLQMKRESQNADQKDQTSFLKREQATKKALQSEGEGIDPEANIIKQNLGATPSEEILNDSLEDGGDHLDEESLIKEGPATVKPCEHSCSTGSHTGEDCKDSDEEFGIRNHNNSKEKLTVLEVKTVSEKASNMTVQSVNNVQLKKLGGVKVEQQKGLDDPEEKSNEFPVISKEESKLELSGSKVVEQQSNPQPEAKEKGCGDSLEKDSIRERWRKHLKGPLTPKCGGTSQECKKDGDEQLVKETKTCQGNSDLFQQEQGISDLLGKNGTTENVGVLKTECDSWSRISSPAAFSIVPGRATKGSRGEGHFQGHLLLSGEHIQPKQEKKGRRSSADFAVLDLEEEDEEDENEKTDDSIDEIVDVVSDYQSEEVDDVEKVNNCVEYIEDDEEQVDIETVEELSEEVNVAHMKTTAAHTQPFKQPCRTHISADEKVAEKSRKAPPIPLKLKPDYWSEKLQKEAEAFAYYRRTHTANERRRRGEMRDLFEKLKITLGLLHSSKVSKSLILTRAFSEIQGLTDQADKLIGQKNLLTRKRNILIRKVSSLSGKTEEVVLKKLEYIYAKQQALEAQKRKKKMGSDEFDVSHRTSKQQEGSSASSVDLGQMVINNRKGKPLILSRKRDQATENTSPSNTPHTSANIVMTPQGQLLTLKGPLFSGPVVTVSPALLEADLKPQVASSAVAQSENDDLFMMPRIVNVTSLATEGGLVDMGGSKYPHEVPAGKSPDHLKNTVRNEDNSFEDSGRISSRGNHRDGRMALGPTQVFLANKDSGFPQIVDVSSMQEAQEFLPKKISSDMRGIQYKWKESESRREKLKPKESPFHKLKMKDLKDSSIEMELRKVASAIEEAALDPSELLTNMEDEDDTDETLTSLLNEIAFLNQQLNDDSVSLAELPNSVDTEFPGDARRAFITKLPPGNRAAFQVGHLGSDLKELPDVQGESDSVSPLLLHLEDDDFSENEKQLAEQASEPDVLKIVIDSEIKDSLLSHRKAGDGGKSTSGIPAEPESVSSPPILHMKAGLENNSTDTLWRPMPKLAPLGLKVANPSSDADGQSLKVMPCLAPIAAKVGSVGHKMNLTGNDQECRESKVMPALAPVVAKLGNSGASPSSAGK